MSDPYVVSCVAKKHSGPSQAKEIYASAWFRKARAYVEATREPWYILSAEHGLLRPDRVIVKYEKTLNKMGVRDRRDWAAMVVGQLCREAPSADRLIVLAGDRYREFLLGDLRRLYPTVEIPLEGLRIGEQLRELERMRREFTT